MDYLLYFLSSDDPLTYTNWLPSAHIDDFHDTEDCAIFVTSRQGQWDEMVCTGFLFSEPPKHHWICQYGKIKHQT